ncbi:MAG: hypothetical protein AAB539_03005 [Patescibacteria group bacterium]
MKNLFEKYPSAAIAALFVLAGGLFVFRSAISRFLSFGPEKPPASAPVEETGKGGAQNDSGGNSTAIEGGKSGVKAPPYAGRDPGQIHPRPDEVKLFSEEQKQKIYAEIGNVGAAVKQNPDFFEGWLQVGILKKTIGDFEGAGDAWAYASMIRPHNSVSFANLGELYAAYLPDYPRAEGNFRAALTNMPDDIGLYVSLSNLYSYSYKEKRDLADDVLMEGIAANPTEAVNLKKALAALYERQGDNAKAITWWKKVLEDEPDNSDVAATITALENGRK